METSNPETEKAFPSKMNDEKAKGLPSKMNDCKLGKLCKEVPFFEQINECELCGKLL